MCMLEGDTDSTDQLVKLHLVEVSHRGVCASYYTMKRNMTIDGTADVNVPDVRCRFSPLDGRSGKEMVADETGGSPVSQESHETKLPGPSTATLNNYEHPLHVEEPLPVEEGLESFDLVKQDAPNTWEIDFKKDPRPFLQSHINGLLSASGWSMFKHQRPCRKYSETIYQSPSGRSVRDFPKVWRQCGEILCADRYHLLQKDCGKVWTDMIQFWSDLADAMMNIEKELEPLDFADSLVHWWSVLDPFVNVVFIQRKILCLRRGKTVKAERSLVIDRKVSSSLLALTDEPQSGKADFLGDSFVKDENVHFDLSLCQVVPYSTQFGSLNGRQQFHIGKDEHYSEPSKFDQKDRLNFTLKKKQRRKSKKISELKTNTLDQNDDTAVWGSRLELIHVEEKNLSSEKGKKRCGKSSANGIGLHQAEKSCSKLKKGRCSDSYRNIDIEDDDLLVSALLKNKGSNPGACRSATKRSASKPKGQSKLKGKRHGCRLLPRNMAKVDECQMNTKWSVVGPRTVLSWLIHADAVSMNDVIQFRNQDDGIVIKDGKVTKDGIMCKCCNIVFSVSKFKFHAGFKLNGPCLNLFTDYGKPLTLCQLQAWSVEYKTRKSRTEVLRIEEDDNNDDSCGVCGDGGELVCCDNCPSTFHQACLHTKELPEGNWYCRQCTCWTCGDLINDKDGTTDAFKCCQCEHKYHDTCRKRKSSSDPACSDAWFCSGNCEEVHLGLRSHIGISNQLANGFCWTLLRCIQDDQNVHTSHRLAFKAECNSKLVVALSIMEECFLSMVDPRTGIDMIPHVLYSWRSEFARLNFYGFYTVVLEKDDIVISVASIRVHGVQVAEMPLVATCSKYRRQGMCRRLVTAVEEMLMSFKVEKLVICAIPELVDTWMKGFGFVHLSDDEKQTLSKINLMVFPGTVLLKKSLHKAKEGLSSAEALTGLAATFYGNHLDEFVPQPLGICCAEENGLGIQQSAFVGEAQSINDGEQEVKPAASSAVTLSSFSQISSTVEDMVESLPVVGTTPNVDCLGDFVPRSLGNCCTEGNGRDMQQSEFVGKAQSVNGGEQEVNHEASAAVTLSSIAQINSDVEDMVESPPIFTNAVGISSHEEPVSGSAYQSNEQNCLEEDAGKGSREGSEMLGQFSIVSGIKAEPAVGISESEVAWCKQSVNADPWPNGRNMSVD